MICGNESLRFRNSIKIISCIYFIRTCWLIHQTHGLARYQVCGDLHVSRLKMFNFPGITFTYGMEAVFLSLSTDLVVPDWTLSHSSDVFGEEYSSVLICFVVSMFFFLAVSFTLLLFTFLFKTVMKKISIEAL